jgi:hypothetical protein
MRNLKKQILEANRMGESLEKSLKEKQHPLNINVKQKKLSFFY